MIEQRTVKSGLASMMRCDKNVGSCNRRDEIVSAEKFFPGSRLIVSWYEDFHSAVFYQCDYTMVVEISG